MDFSTIIHYRISGSIEISIVYEVSVLLNHLSGIASDSGHVYVHVRLSRILIYLILCNRIVLICKNKVELRRICIIK